MERRARPERRKVSSLRAHPCQEECYGLPHVDDPDIVELAQDIELRGMKERPEIRPDGTLISGHRRCAAIRRLEWAEVHVVVRYDLDDAGAEAEFLRANLFRRNLTPLQVAQRNVRLLQLENPSLLDEDVKHEAVCRIAHRIGESPKNFQRYLDVLQLPLELQNAFNHREITLIEASRAGRLPAEGHARIVEAARSGVSFKAAIARELAAMNRPAALKPASLLSKAARHLRDLREHSPEMLRLRLDFVVEDDWPDLFLASALLLRKLATLARHALEKRAADDNIEAGALDRPSDIGISDDGI